MPLIFVTGNSGAGKSSVCGELRLRGYRAYDTDEDGITCWRHKITDAVVVRPVDVASRGPNWYEDHVWKMSRERVEALAASAEDGPVFLCGSPSNADELSEMFDAIACLTVDLDTLRFRLADRPDNDYGKAPDELRGILGWHRAFEDRYERGGAFMVDATRPLSIVVDTIVTLCATCGA